MKTAMIANLLIASIQEKRKINSALAKTLNTEPINNNIIKETTTNELIKNYIIEKNISNNIKPE